MTQKMSEMHPKKSSRVTKNIVSHQSMQSVLCEVTIDFVLAGWDPDCDGVVFVDRGPHSSGRLNQFLSVQIKQ